MLDAPAKAKAPLFKTHPKKILLALQKERKKNKGIGKYNWPNAKRNMY